MNQPHVIPDPPSAALKVATKFLLMKPGAAPRVLDHPMSARPGYDEIKKIIEPLIGLQPLEHVPVLHEGTRLDMFVDHTSALRRLPRNEDATRVYRNNWLTQHPGTDPETLPAIYGPAVLALRRIWF